ncbi:hypothetical protein [Brevibacterium sp.]|uniref:hypothetical protein n=1 Tax=Brevibacterium sp. TaxID=1701 RepID=UPI002811C765|nr:hypothetical protein [Brevibacterium sp.]
MRVLFQGAGAVGIAGTALFIDAHEVAVVSRNPRTGSAYPERLSALTSRPRARRRVPITAWETALEFEWDLLVLTTRPCELDAEVVDAIAVLAPPLLAITSQVEGDLDEARARFAPAEVVVFSPALVSDRPAGTDVSYWSLPAGPAFLMAGDSVVERRLRRELGSLVLSVPLAVLLRTPAVFIPYVAELSARNGNWDALKSHLDLPTAAAAEAVGVVTGMRVPMNSTAARLALEMAERVLPIDVSEYAGRHFGRHRGQTVDMLDGWIEEADQRGTRSPHALQSLRLSLEGTAAEQCPRQ